MPPAIRALPSVSVLALSLFWLAGLCAEDAPPVEPPPLPTDPTPAPVPAPAPSPFTPLVPPPPPHAAQAARPLRPPSGVQEGPYYSATGGAAGLLFDVSRSMDGEPLSRRSADFRFAYARDWHRGDGGLGDWFGVRCIARYRAAEVLLAYDDRRFGPPDTWKTGRFQALHALFGGVVERGHAKPFDDAGFGVCLWWPEDTGQVRVIPEVGFRSTLWRAPAYKASVAGYRRGEAQVNSPVWTSFEVYGSTAWNFKSVQGWIYDGGAQFCIGLGRFQAGAGYQIWGIRRHVAQGPVVSATLYF
ncbi:MAG TPA: hypothetical protein VL860_14270 [Planctomycetota bacterium]|nr:hypothetical protein [Planctomycetota bacterium]